MSVESPNKIALLKKRSEFLKRARDFFYKRNFTEVDCPILSSCASVDEHIDLIPALFAKKTTLYLHSSPEYGMKQLLCLGSGDIFQLSHVFRDDEIGPRHAAEFTLCEWYRVGLDFDAFAQETLDFIQIFTGPQTIERITYRDLFLRHCQIDPFQTDRQELFDQIKELKLSPYSQLSSEDLDAHLNFLLGSYIEPKLPKDQLTLLIDYPPSQAALAKVRKKEELLIAERFEIYWGDLELANGYNELADAAEQRKRLNEANKKRVARGKQSLPLDENFLKALSLGLPPCCGVAVGFDRLMMRVCQLSAIAELNIAL